MKSTLSQMLGQITSIPKSESLFIVGLGQQKATISCIEVLNKPSDYEKDQAL